MSLMLLVTLKIVSCLKNYYYDNHDNTDIVKFLCVPTSLYKHVLTEFEYQLQLEFDICIEPTRNYRYPNEYWEKMWKFHSNAVRWKWKDMTVPLITIYSQFLKQTLCCILPLFHDFVIWDWNHVPVLLCTVWLCQLIFLKKDFSSQFVPHNWQSWKWYINSIVMKLLQLNTIIEYMTVKYWLWKYCM